MLQRADKDVISQAEMRKGVEFMNGISPAIRLVGELYMHALKRRLANGALIEPGPLSFNSLVGVICKKKDAGTETKVEACRSRRHSIGLGSSLGHS
jgi:hypothetical protein